MKHPPTPSLVTLTFALTVALAVAGVAQEQPKAPPAPQAPPAPKQLTKEEIDALLKKKQEEMQKAQAQQQQQPKEGPARTIPTRRPPTAPATLPAAPQPPAVQVGAPALPALQPATPAAQAAQPGQAQTVQPAAPALPGPGQQAVGQVAAAARGGAAAGGEEKVLPPGFINFKNMDLFQALDFYAELVNRTVIRPQALPAGQITIRSQTELTPEEAIQALEHVFALNGITAVPVGAKFVEVVTSAAALQSAAAFSKKDAEDLPEAAQFITQVVQLKHAMPADVMPAIQQFARLANGVVGVDASRTLVIRDYAINVKRMMEIIEAIDIEVPLEVELELIPIRFAPVADVSAVLGSLTSGGAITPTGTTTGRTSAGTTRRPGTTGGLGVTTGGFGQPGGQQGQFGQPGGGFTPQQQQIQRPGGTTTLGGGAPGAVSSFQDRLRQIVSRAASGEEVPLLGNAKIIPDERSNSLLVFGTKVEREQVKKIVAEIDKVQPQVLIEAIIVEVQLNDSKDLGVSVAQNQKRFGKDFTGAGGAANGPAFLSTLTNAAPIGNVLGQGFTYYGLLGPTWEVALNAVATDSRFEVLSRPRIQTSHAAEASIFVGETRPFPTGSVSFGGQATTQIQNQSIGISLNVLPLINIDGLVVLDIAQEVNQIGEEIQVDQFLRVPAIVARSATSRVAVKDGDTIILGGFITTEKRTSKAGVPFLKDIPGLGVLFRSKSDDVVKRELIVFLRPTVLPTPEVAAVAAANEREKMVDVKKTETDLRREEQERYRKLEKELQKSQEREQRRK